jgi:hypothetical protein
LGNKPLIIYGGQNGALLFIVERDIQMIFLGKVYLTLIVKKIDRNQETNEVWKHFRLRYGLILVFCNNKTLIMQQILGNTNHMIKGHDITSLHYHV